MTVLKESGLGWTTFSVDNSAGVVKAIKNDITSLAFGTPRGVQEVTGLDKLAPERILLLTDFTVNPTGVFNDTVDLSFDVFKTVPSSAVARTVTMVISGQTLANECLFTDFSWARDDSGTLIWQAPGVLADGTVPTWS